MRSLSLIFLVLFCGMLASSVRAETFRLANGESISGEVLSASANDQGVQVKVGDGQYQRIPWANFSQEDLRNFAKNQKMQPYVEPFIEITQEEKIKKTEINIKQPTRLERPERQSLFGALFSSGLGVFVMLLLYAATIYAGYEVALFRAQPLPLVCGLSAIPFLGFLAPIIFLCMPTKMAKRAEEEVEEPQAPAEAAAAPMSAATRDDVNPMRSATVETPIGVKLAQTDTGQRKPALPEPVTFQRGQFTFNRRFFETKFPGFFGTVRRDADRDMILIIKTTSAEHPGHRISRIAANDLHLEVQREGVTQEVMITFQEIQKIILKHKDA